MMIELIIEARYLGFSLWNVDIYEPSHPHQGALTRVVWLFYVSKIPEFLDTALMLLKQNYRQVSVLHVYHHSTVFLFWSWVVCRAPGGDVYYSATVNSGIHVIM